MPLRATAAVCTTMGLRLRHLHKRPQTLIGVMFGGVSAKLIVSTPDRVFERHGAGQGASTFWWRAST